MKLFHIAAAGLVALAGLAPVAPAVAAPQRHYESRTVVKHRTVVRNNHRARTRQVCRVERHRGQSRRICRTVRR